MAYGTGTNVENMVWGNTRPTPPTIVAIALGLATDWINNELNIPTELTGTDKPAKFDKIADLWAAGYIQNQRKPEIKVQNTINAEKQLDKLKDETAEGSMGDPINIHFLDDE